MENMETRKIQKTGKATYTLSLPKAWILKNKLKPADKISIIEEKDQSLKISLEENYKTDKDVVIRIKDFTSTDEILRKFTAQYLDGATKISIIFEKSPPGDIRGSILQNIKKYMGFEIVEESQDKIITQDFFTSDNLSLIKTIKREFGISKLAIEENRKILKREVKSIEGLTLWEQEVDKLYLLIRRQLSFALHNSNVLRKFSVSMKECLDFLLLIDSIEKITDAFFEIGENALKIDKLSDSTLKRLSYVYSLILESYDMAFDSIIKKDFNLSNLALGKINKILDYSISAERNDISEKNRKSFYILLASLHTITTYLEEIAEIGLGVV
jgi:phosphate uptake regulator